MTDDAAETPLIELLMAVPSDYRAEWTDADGLQATHSAPVGKYCHRAAAALAAMPQSARIAALEAMLGEAREVMISAFANPEALMKSETAMNRFATVLNNIAKLGPQS